MRYSLTLAALSALAGLPAAAAAQAVLDWPLAVEARPMPLVTGAGAVFGNPAGTAQLHARAEGLVADLETPHEMGLHALSVAAAVRVFGGVSVAAGYRHLGVGDMLLTDGPPVGSPSAPTPSLEVAEDVYTVGLSLAQDAFGAGIAARLDTPADELGGEPSWAVTSGVIIAPVTSVLTLRVGGTIEIDPDHPAFAGAAEVGSPPLLEKRLRIALAYGGTQEAKLGVAHAIVGTADWRGLAELQLGAVAQPGAGDATWVPLVAGLLTFGRYRVGIVREHLPNGFGAAMHYQLSVVF